MSAANQVTATALAVDSGIRVQMWTGDDTTTGMCASGTITVSEAEKLIERLQRAIEMTPRETSAADLGLAA